MRMLPDTVAVPLAVAVAVPVSAKKFSVGFFVLCPSLLLFSINSSREREKRREGEEREEEKKG